MCVHVFCFLHIKKNGIGSNTHRIHREVSGDRNTTMQTGTQQTVTVKQIKMENKNGNKKKWLWGLSYSLKGQKRQQRAERQRKNEKGEVKEETEGETRDYSQIHFQTC